MKTSSGTPFQNCGAYYYNIVGLNLERDIHQAHRGVMVRCLQTFVHIVYFSLYILQNGKSFLSTAPLQSWGL